MNLLEEFKQTGEWQDYLLAVRDDIAEISDFLDKERSDGKVVYPLPGMILAALKATHPGDIRAVITGQDPYHGEKSGMPQAMGLAFSVPDSVPTPPSLKNIQKELHESLGIKPSGRGDLTRWSSEEGVLLLNASLSVVEGAPGSHAKIGWSRITRAILEVVNGQTNPVAFLAWGKHSHKLSESMNSTRHKVIRTSHPSPLGARKSGEGFKAFLGSRCFVEANDFLSDNGVPPINWSN